MKRICALRYSADDGDAAPIVIAQGEGDLAERMERAALAYGIPVVRDVPLSQALADLKEGQPIPEALFEAVAVILREIT